MPYGQTAPPINPHTFPYHRKWTKDETDELIDRINKLRAAMTDMVGPSGVSMFIDPGVIAHIATHLALAGGDLHPLEDPRTFIWPEVQEDQQGIFEAFIRWRVKKDHRLPPPPTDEQLAEVEAKAAAARAQIDAQLPPDVRAALIKQLRKEFEHDTTDTEDGSES